MSLNQSYVAVKCESHREMLLPSRMAITNITYGQGADGSQTDPEYGTRGSQDCGRATSIGAEGGPRTKESPILAFKLSRGGH